MPLESGILVATLVAYMLALLAVGLWASRRTHDETDFLLGGRALGPVVAALSYSASASSAWSLLGLSGAAYALGLRALWIACGSVIGMLVAWFWIAPRLLARSRDAGHLTLTDFIAEGSRGRWRTAIVGLASLIVLLAFVMYVAAQFQAAGSSFESALGLPLAVAIPLGALVILAYTLLGGFWAVSVTDALQAGLMALTALLLPLAAVLAAGGPVAMWATLAAQGPAGFLDPFAGSVGLVALGILIGSLAISLGTFGQPQLLVRFMALRDARARRQAAWITVAWYGLVYFGMVLLGLAGRALLPAIDNPESLFFQLAGSLFGPLLGAVLLAAVLSAIMSTADSQLVVSASAISHDLGLARRFPGHVLWITRLSVALVVVFAVLLALVAPASIFDRVLLSWIALGSAFGPLVFVRLSGGRPHPGLVLASIALGFSLAISLPSLLSSPGMAVERTLPFLLALAVLLPALSGRRG